jgi:hypothetical protein
VDAIKRSIQFDLRSSSLNSWMGSGPDPDADFRCIVANAETGEIELHSGGKSYKTFCP